MISYTRLNNVRDWCSCSYPTEVSGRALTSSYQYQYQNRSSVTFVFFFTSLQSHQITKSSIFFLLPRDLFILLHLFQDWIVHFASSWHLILPNIPPTQCLKQSIKSFLRSFIGLVMWGRLMVRQFPSQFERRVELDEVFGDEADDWSAIREICRSVHAGCYVDYG